MSQQRESLIQVQTKMAEMNGVHAQLERFFFVLLSFVKENKFYLHPWFRERERLSKNQEELETTRQLNSDMEQDMQRCRSKEIELLEFTQKLTEKNVAVQSDYTALQDKVFRLNSYLQCL